MSRSNGEKSEMFHLQTTRWVPIPVESVWERAVCIEDWPQWWKSLSSCSRLSTGGYRLHWKGAFFYNLITDVQVQKMEAFTRIDGTLSGDLIGTGRCRLVSDNGKTCIQFDISVTPVKRWMVLLSPLLKAWFIRNHHRIMDEGIAGFLSLEDSCL